MMHTTLTPRTFNGPLSLLKQRAAGAIDLTDPSDGFDGLVQGVDQEAGHPVLDEFGHRAPFEGDDRGAASHRLDDGEAERLVDVIRCNSARASPSVLAREDPPTGPRYAIRLPSMAGAIRRLK